MFSRPGAVRTMCQAGVAVRDDLGSERADLALELGGDLEGVALDLRRWVVL